ncbi:proton-conducting transporter transmembrane domain-containing protein, partial [Modestobacter roseus]
EEHRVGAGLTAFLTTRTADLGLYLAAGAALAGGAGLGLDDLAAADGPWLHVAAAGMLVAALGKAAQLPFTAWLSAAMQGPSPVSALLHSAAMVAMGGYLLLRMEPLLAATGWAGPTAAWVGALTALLLGAVAIAQRDLKQLLAASTAAQLGFVVLGAGVGSVAGGTAHLVAHAATKALLFLVAGAWLTALGTKQLTALRGAARRWPLVGVGAGIGALALAGVVPLSLWATKDEVLAGAREESLPLYLVGLAAAALSAGYAGKVLWLVWRPAPADPADDGLDTEEEGTRRVGGLQQAPLVVLA